ncbi:tRNA uridine-5-carboxymethylaminomethyl(34) synthesis GTPase MnmE [Geotoga petraea]|uniref:tRNA modification GTPase MnmE n=1 Tax=Geotoga petraea TaxID=28234 RepID=A0A1G6K1Q1_9BACT|nr:tRNA uridine-5-carboxymethylaminomethyl(34) synthesis GTPase MnmE [Geotoga petraea]TGG88391.1 tRNA uridine-5-carboxymethylaminomethyl(34) synthesis GTPase MnmE [Geotoga petraea]SDC24818.1 tRNA modification GTPase trmE [Geotoga petraea]
MFKDTIVALSSSYGISAIGVIRISGNNVEDIIRNHLRKSFKPKKMYYNWFIDNEKKIDEITWTFHKGPKSYTGEDMLEIFCHGGPKIIEELITILKRYSRDAIEGEFSKRAVLNNKMDLIKAESINNMIHSETELSLDASRNQVTMGLSKDISKIEKDLLDLSTEIEVELDYPDDIAFESESDTLKNKVDSIIKAGKEILLNADNGIMAVHGIKTAIVGKPNSGKSTLLNALLRKDRAIVTDIPGTTRDTIEENLNIKGIYLRVIDTAGIRESEDKIEKIGIQKSIDSIKNSDLIIFIVDGSNPNKDDEKIFEKINKDYKNKELIIVLNKNDDKNFVQPFFLKNYHYISISAKEGNIKDLEEEIYKKFINKLTIKKPLLTNSRQKDILKETLNHLEKASNNIENGISKDFIMFDIRKALEKIYELNGKNYNEEMLNNLFSNFCVGK